MILADVIDDLVAAGASPEVIKIAVRAIEDAKAGDKASRSAQLKSERNRRYYKKLNDGRLIKTPENALPPTENALNPSESRAPTRVRVLYAEESSSKIPLSETTSPHPQTAKPQRRATRLTATFSPSPSMREFAKSHGMTDREIDAEGETMRDWSLSSPAGAKLDWEATWRGWIKRRKQQPARASPNGSRQARIDADAAFFKWAMEPDDEPRNSQTPDIFDGPTIDAVATRVS